MPNKILNSLNRLFKRSHRRDDEVVTTCPDEFNLLIQQKRLVDFSQVSQSLQLPIKIGIYLDTYKHLTSGLKKELAKSNLENILSSIPVIYKEIEDEKSNIIANDIGAFKRIFKNFTANNLYMLEGKTSSDFCLNLYVRPDNESFIVIGKAPKGKLKKAAQNESVPDKSPKLSDNSWETVDFK